jgi:hypothetical protein
MNLIREIWQSIVRRDPLTTDKGKSELVFLNVWLHIHPAKVKKENLTWVSSPSFSFSSWSPPG